MGGKKEPQKATIIAVSFANNDEDEVQLYNDILRASKGMGKSTWMKFAAREKLERDNSMNNTVVVHSVQQPVIQQPVRATNNQKEQSTVVDSLDELFK